MSFGTWLNQVNLTMAVQSLLLRVNSPTSCDEVRGRSCELNMCSDSPTNSIFSAVCTVMYEGTNLPDTENDLAFVVHCGTSDSFCQHKTNSNITSYTSMTGVTERYSRQT